MSNFEAIFSLEVSQIGGTILSPRPEGQNCQDTILGAFGARQSENHEGFHHWSLSSAWRVRGILLVKLVSLFNTALKGWQVV